MTGRRPLNRLIGALVNAVMLRLMNVQSGVDTDPIN